MSLSRGRHRHRAGRVRRHRRLAGRRSHGHPAGFDGARHVQPLSRPVDAHVRDRASEGCGRHGRPGCAHLRCPDSHRDDPAERLAECVGHVHRGGDDRRQGRRRDAARRSTDIVLHHDHMPVLALCGTAAPTAIGNPTSDGRSGAGPFSYELGMKFTVSRTATLIGIRYYRDSREDGDAHRQGLERLGHVARNGDVHRRERVRLAGRAVRDTADADGEHDVRRLGQRQCLLRRHDVGIGDTTDLRSHLVGRGGNGVFGPAAGTFPTSSYSSSNYFVDAVVR